MAVMLHLLVQGWSMWLNVSQCGCEYHGPNRNEEFDVGAAGVPSSQVETDAIMPTDGSKCLIERYRSGLKRYEMW